MCPSITENQFNALTRESIHFQFFNFASLRMPPMASDQVWIYLRTCGYLFIMSTSCIIDTLDSPPNIPPVNIYTQNRTPCSLPDLSSYYE